MLDYGEGSEQYHSVYNGYIYILSGPESPNEVVPALYLDPTLSFDGIGDGSSGNPYKLIVK